MKKVAVLTVLAVLAAGCGNGSGGSPPVDVVPEQRSGDAPTVDADATPDEQSREETAPPPPDYLWPGGDAPVAWNGWVEEREWLKDVSSWSFGNDQPKPDPDFRLLPDFALGNGYAFSMMGYSYPINTLHSMTGPIYDKGDGFFGDTWLEVSSGPEGQAMQWKHEWIGRVRKTAIMHTRAEGPVVALSTVDFAPLLQATGDPVQRSIVRLVFVENVTQQTLTNLWLRVGFTRSQEVLGDGVVEHRLPRLRRTVILPAGDVSASEAGLKKPVGDLAAGEYALVTVAYMLDDDEQLAGETLVALYEQQADHDLLTATRDAWFAWLAPSLEVNTPDPRINDYLRAVKVILLSQQAATGAACVMCEYTRTWLRDNAGPVRFFLKIGLYEEVRGILDYLRLAALAKGGIGNSYPADLTPADAGPEPDWESMPIMSGRERAESPSYIPLLHSWYWQASGMADFIAERMPMMRHCLEKQAFEGDFLPFSTDETFRTAMAVAHGLNFLEQFEEGYLSANSSFIWVAAAERLAAMAAEVGEDETADTLLVRAEEVRAAANEKFLDEDGWYVPYEHEADGPAPAPFEDVNLKPLWTGYMPPDAEMALINLEQTISVIGGEDGILVSPLPEEYANFMDLPVSEGFYTGMSPGYFLSNLAVTFHPLAEAAFNALALHAQAGGSLAEYQILDDFTPAHLIYDNVGGIGDYTARYRPWEGGIVGDAAYDYLLGNVADGRSGELTLAPNLPNGWAWLEAANVRCGDSRIDIRIDRKGDNTTVVLTHTEGPALTVAISLALDEESTNVAALIDGEEVSSVVETYRWDNRRASFPTFNLPAGETATLLLME